jgi:hypothetical protein
MKHTKGPWEVKSYSNSNKKFVVTKHGTIIHEFVDALAVDVSNAQLIAAAPELLEALKYAIQDLEDLKRQGVNMQGVSLKAFKNAISKAEGKE